MSEKTVTVGLVDDHVLMRKSLAGFVNSCRPYRVSIEADNGRDLLDKLVAEPVPNIVLLDINMPEMDGFDTALHLKNSYPTVKVLALSMYDSEESVIRMLRNGACGYLLKDTDPEDFKRALDEVTEKGVYYSDAVTGRLIHAINSYNRPYKNGPIVPNGRELEFLLLVCSELTYKEIAERMSLSPRTIDGYRDILFERLGVRSRVGLVLYAIKNGIFKI